MNRRNFSFASQLILIAGLGVSLSGCSSEKRTETVAPETVSDVAVIAVHKMAVPDSLEAVGTVRAAQTTQIASQMMGNIREIRAQEGDRVQAGQVLAVIDDSQPRSAVDQATAAVLAATKETAAADSDYALSESTLKRYQQLFDRKSVSPQEFDEMKARAMGTGSRLEMAKAGEAQANAALAQAKTSLGYTLVHAPFAGVITEKKADVGTMAAPGMPIFTLEDTRHYRLEVTVDESSMRAVHSGQSVSISLDALGGAEITGKVEQVVPAADSASRSFLVKIGLPPNAQIRSGLFGRARFPLNTRQALMIPQAAVINRGQLQGIYAVDANHLTTLRYVTLGKTSGQQVEVLSGLQDGETIVASPGTRELGGKQIAAKQ